jgi:hypothetical protein
MEASPSQHVQWTAFSKQLVEALRRKQKCPFSESDDLLSIVIWLDAAIFI